MNRLTTALATLLMALPACLQAQDMLAPDTLVQDTLAQDTTPRRPALALKSNMLGDLGLGFNIEAELPLDSLQRWTLTAEYWTPWYVWHHNSRAYELQVVSAELRHWFHRRGHDPLEQRALQGWFAGIYFAAGKYDFEWDSSGDQGELLSAGLSGGYGWRIGRNLRLEGSLALGVLWGPRSHYSGRFNDTHLIWEYDKHDLYFGPTKLKLSLVWIINRKKKGGRA